MWLASEPPHSLYWGLTLLMLGAFSVGGALSFFVLFELSLVPIAILILVTGARPERVEAVIYMAAYTLVGGGLHVLGLVYLSSALGGLSFAAQESGGVLMGVWAVLVLALLVKVPFYGVHL